MQISLDPESNPKTKMEEELENEEQEENRTGYGKKVIMNH